ncbi:MAG: 3-phosphoshikimate 1-carboxyvinyltransferase, partial [Pseudomonadota bacterium]
MSSASNMGSNGGSNGGSGAGGHHGPKRPARCAGGTPLVGTLKVPGDKSISHRSLLFGLLARGETIVSGLLEGEDVLATAAAARALGAVVEKAEDGRWHVTGAGLGALVPPASPLDYGNAGTGVRLAMGIIAGHGIRATLDGDASLRKRPMKRVLEPLLQMGARVESADPDRLPLTLVGTASPVPLTYTVPVPSAQVKSAVLFAALSSPGITTIVEAVRTRDHTERMLKWFGADIVAADDGAGRRIVLKGRPALTARPVTVPADPSSTAFALVAGTIVPGSDLTIENVLMNPDRTGLITTLQEMGADISVSDARETGGEPLATVRVRHAKLKGINVPADRAPSMIDEYPVLAVAASV